MGALDPAGAFHHGSREHAGFAQQFQPDAGAHNIHDGIHRAHLVKVNRFHRLTVNPALHLRQALEHGGGFLLHPRGQLAGGNQSFDVRKGPGIIVMMLVVVPLAVLMLVMGLAPSIWLPSIESGVQPLPLRSSATELGAPSLRHFPVAWVRNHEISIAKSPIAQTLTQGEGQR